MSSLKSSPVLPLWTKLSSHPIVFIGTILNSMTELLLVFFWVTELMCVDEPGVKLHISAEYHQIRHSQESCDWKYPEGHPTSLVICHVLGSKFSDEECRYEEFHVK